MKVTSISVIVFLVTLQVIAEPRFSADYSVPSEVIDSGGEVISSPNYTVGDSVAQPSIIGTGTGGTYTIYHGFWGPGLGRGGSNFSPDVVHGTGLSSSSDGNGVSWGDFDRDGDWDFFVARGSGADQDFLFENQGNGTFSEVAVASGITEAVQGTGGSWSDFDADGNLDLFVTNAPGTPAVLWKNDGATFSEESASVGLSGNLTGISGAWGDYNGDGLTDLFIANDSGGIPELYRNLGNGGFTLANAGLTDNTTGVGIWGDYDNDGDLDIFVVQDTGLNDILYRNQGDGTFNNVSVAANISDLNSGKSAAWGDYNNDGFLDLYVVNGGAECDILYRNEGNGTFTDITGLASISDTSDGRGAAWADMDNDGDLDLYVTNASNQRDVLYRNNSDGTFTSRPGYYTRSSYGSAWADYDTDGDVDLLVSSAGDLFSLFRNDCDNKRFLKVRVLDGNGHRTCYGAQVRIYEAGTTNLVAMRQVDGGHGAGSQDMYDCHFGLDPTALYDIEVRYTKTWGGSPIIINSTVNPDLANVQPEDVDLGHIEVRDNGRVQITIGVAYTASESGNEDIWLLSRDGDNARQLTTDLGEDRDPSWSPDGNKLVFSSNRDTDWDLYVLEVGGVEMPLTFDAANNTQPAWSSDGNTIAFVSDRDINQEIYVIDTAGEGARNLTANPAADTNPAWSPNSGKIAFVSDRNANEDIYKMNFDGSNVEQLTTDPATDSQPAWSPDGLQVAFTSYRDGNAEVYIMNFDGTGKLNITNLPSDDQHPAWTPDGKEIVFQSNRDGNEELYICNAQDGSNVRRMTENSTYDGTPNYPMAFRYPPRSIVFGTNNGRTTYWADPVNTDLGNYTYQQADFVLPGRGIPIKFTRHYNSQDPLDGPLGFGWGHSYLISVTEGVDGDATITWGDGHQDFFRLLPSGDYILWDGSVEGTLSKTGGFFSLITKGQVTYAFDVAGRLESITNKNGEAHLLTYSGDDLVSIVQSNGRNLTLGYVAGRLTTVTDHTGRTVEYQYDLDGNLSQFTNTRGKTYTIIYDPNHRLVSVIDPLGITKFTNVYDANGRVERQFDAMNEETIYSYNDITRMTTITDRRNNIWKHQYDALRQLRAIVDPDGNQVQLGYDPQGNRNQGIDRLGNVTVYPTTPDGQVAGKTDALGNTASVVNDPATGLPTSYEDPLSRQMDYAYDLQGNLETITNPDGQTATTTYNAYGKPLTITDELNNTTTFAYHPEGDLATITDEANRVTSLTYDALGRLTSRTDPEEHTLSYTYNANNALETISDERGGLTTFAYDDADRLTSVITKLNATENAVTSFIYDNASHITTRTGPRGYPTTYTYDPEGNLSSVTDALTNTTAFQYDPLNRLTRVTAADGGETDFEYDANGNITRMIDPRDNATEFEYDAAGRLMLVRDALGYTVINEYDGAGQLVRQTDQRTKDWLTAYDDLGRIESITDPMGHSSNYVYDLVGNLRYVTDENNHTTEYVYNNVYNLVQVIGANTESTTYTYDGNGRLKTVTDPENNITKYFYDEAGNLIQIKDPLNNDTFYQYDLAGRRIGFTDADGNSETYTYDLSGNRVALTDRNGFTTLWEYDKLGRVSKIIDAESREITYEYDAVGRLAKVINPALNDVVYQYDLAGNLTSITNARDYTTTREYDALNRLWIARDPLLREDIYEYDEAGNLAKHTTADMLFTTYQYDDAGRLERAEYPNATSADYTYDNAGNLLNIVNHQGTSTYIYDNMDRLTSYTDVFGKTVGYEYDGNGQVSAIIYPDGKRVEYTYDPLERMKTVEDWLTNVTSYQYDAVGNLERTNNANGTRAIYGYDNAQRLTSLSNEKSDGTTISAYNYTLDKVGNKIAEDRTDPLLPFPETDALTHTHDAADQLLNADAATFTHDAKGNIVSHDFEGAHTFTFDYENRLIQATTPDVTSDYDYDNSGNRIEAIHDGVTTRYTLDVNRGLVSVLTENDAADEPQAYYVFGIGLVSRVEGGQAQTYHFDGIGSTAALTDAAEASLDAYVYDVFGHLLDESAVANQPFTYVGAFGVMTEHNHLLHMRARYYDPILGRFFSTDPIEEGLNHYVYAWNHPSRFIDPTGLSTFLDDFYDRFGYDMDEALLAGVVSLAGEAASHASSVVSGYVLGVLLMPELVGCDDRKYGAEACYGPWVEFERPTPIWNAYREGLNFSWNPELDKSLNEEETLVSVSDIWSAYDEDEKILFLNRLNEALDVGGRVSGSDTSRLVTDPLTGQTVTLDQAALRAASAARDRASQSASNARAQERNRIRAQYLQQAAQVQSQVNALTGGRGFEAMAGRGEMVYSTVDIMGMPFTYLSGYWYTNVSRIVSTRIPKPDISPWLAAHAALRRSVAESIISQYGPDGINVPWIPEVYEAYVVDGEFAVYGK